MKTNEIESSISSLDQRVFSDNADWQVRGIWECALQLSIIASKLPDPDGSVSELTRREIEQLEEENSVARKKWADLTSRVKLARELIDKALGSTRPYEIQGYLKSAKNWLEPR